MRRDLQRNKTRRVFFAALPEASVREQLQAYLHESDWAAHERLRWLPPANWHVTLRFVGDVAPAVVVQLEEMLCDTAPRHVSFLLSLSTIEAFPNNKRPLVLAATGAAPADGQALVSDLERACRALQLPAERRPWRPHLTLARVRGRGRLQHPGLPVQVDLRVARVCLMESVAAEHGRNYVSLNAVALR